MCDGFSTVALAVGAIASVAGTAISYQSGQAAASAARSAAAQASAAQNAAFGQRLSAQQQQLSDQTALANQSAARFDVNQQNEQKDLLAQLQNRSDTVDALNTTQQAAAQQRDTTVQQGVDTISGQAMQDAQASQAQAQSAMNAPIVSAIQSSNPLGAANSGLVREAMDKGNTGSAKFVQDYGDTQSRLSAYSAPLQLAGQTATNIGTNLMPQTVMDNINRSSAPALLAPSTLAYQQAKDYGEAVNTANAMTNSSAQALVKSKYDNAVTLADLLQNDSAADIQSRLNVAQANAAAGSAMGSGISALGNLGVSYGASQGGVAKVKAAAKSAIG